MPALYIEQDSSDLRCCQFDWFCTLETTRAKSVCRHTPFILTTPLAGGTSVKVLPIPTGLAAMIIILKVLIMHKKDGVAQADHIMLL